MTYRSVRILAPYSAEGVGTTRQVDSALKKWADAGWSLHSQSMTTFISGGGGMYPATSSHEIVLLIFQKE